MAWSYSALTAFEQCPQRFFRTRVAKDVSEPETEVLLWGNAVHKALENRVAQDKPLPTGMTQWEPLVQKILAAGGTLFTEKQIALDRSFTPVEWFSPRAWVRGVIDLGMVRGTKLVAIDYKTGKPKEDNDQLKLFAALLMAVYPDAEVVKTGFLWLKTKQITQSVYSPGDLPNIWNAFLPRVRRLEEAHATNQWPTRPSGLCRAWCPCTGCEYNGRK